MMPWSWRSPGSGAGWGGTAAVAPTTAPPDLRNLDDGDLRFSTDFRAVYAAVLEQWLDTEAASVLRGGGSPLPLLAG